jgi:hypothetical protein
MIPVAMRAFAANMKYLRLPRRLHTARPALRKCYPHEKIILADYALRENCRARAVELGSKIARQDSNAFRKSGQQTR